MRDCNGIMFSGIFLVFFNDGVELVEYGEHLGDFLRDCTGDDGDLFLRDCTGGDFLRDWSGGDFLRDCTGDFLRGCTGGDFLWFSGTTSFNLG